MHPGHVLMLKECKRYCDYLIVAVNEYRTKTKQPDGREKNEPIWTPKERLLMVEACKFVDEAFLFDAIDNLASGEEIDPADTKATGCSIKRIKN